MESVFDENGMERFCGCKPRSTKVGQGPFKVVGYDVETVVIKPRSEWSDTDLSHHSWHMHQQGPQNSCCPTMYCGLLELEREIQGLERVAFSQAYAYHYTNDGADTGAPLDEVFMCLMNRGTVPASVIDPMDWRGKDWPEDADEIAEKWRVAEGWDIPNTDALGSVLEAGHPGGIGVFWDYPRKRGGHAILVVGKRQTSPGVWDWKIQNSWGKSYGENGFGWLREAQVAQGIQYFGSFAARFQRIQSTDPMPLSAAV